MYVVSGSTSVTPFAMCAALIRSRTTRIASARSAARVDPHRAADVDPTAEIRSPLSMRIGKTSFR